MRRLTAAALLSALPALVAAAPPAAGLNRFAVDAYRELSPAPGNLIYSPFSISTALSMLLAGARGSTASEIARTLGQPGADAAYHAELAALIAQLLEQSNGAGSQLSVANALWPDRSVRLQPAFRDIAAASYKAPLTLLDFSTPESARAQINSWTEQQTHGKIRDLFAPGSLTADTRLVLTSAIYFNGGWQTTFDPKATRPAPFHTARADVQADFMRRTAHFGYAEPHNLQILEMSYAGTQLVFDALLPKDGNLNSLEHNLTPENLAKWFAAIEDRRVDVSLPRFKTESSFSLRGQLSKMGMPSAFTRAADLSAIDGRRDLFVSDVVHKAFVEVNETGTVAAAATGIAMARAAMLVEGPPAVFRADHPFVFLIRDSQSGAILFAGRVANPRL